MSKAALAKGALASFRELYEALLPNKLDDYNKLVAKLRKSNKTEAELSELRSWAELLDASNKVPRNFKLSEMADEAVAREARGDGAQLRRVQTTDNIEPGTSYSKGWLGTHFDTTGGLQLLDVLSAQKRLRPTQLPPQYQVLADVDPSARGLVVSDFAANNPRLSAWQTLMQRAQPYSNKESQLLEQDLRDRGIGWLMYPNTFEGVNPARKGELPFGREITEGLSYADALEQLHNPSVSVINPKAINIRSIKKKQGGLVQMGTL